MNIVAKTQNSAPEETDFLCTYLASICKDIYISRWGRIVRMLDSCEPGMEHEFLFMPHYAADSDAGRQCMYHVSAQGAYGNRRPCQRVPSMNEVGLRMKSGMLLLTEGWRHRGNYWVDAGKETSSQSSPGTFLKSSKGSFEWVLVTHFEDTYGAPCGASGAMLGAASSPENSTGTLCLENQASLQECRVWIPLGDPTCSFPLMDSRSPCHTVL